MRIISGTLKGRKLAGPGAAALRPTSDRVKESMFNIIGGEIEGKVVLDLFAGTGNLGIEALSRGAKSAVFVEKSRQALRLLEKNLSTCQVGNRSEVLFKEAIQAIGHLKGRGACFDLIFVDPPYEKGLIERTIEKLLAEKIYSDNSLLVIEHDRREPLSRHDKLWSLILQRRIGDTVISFLRPLKPESSKQDPFSLILLDAYAEL